MKLRPVYNEQIKRMVEYFDYKYSYGFTNQYIGYGFGSVWLTPMSNKSEGWWQKHNWIHNGISEIVYDSTDELILLADDGVYAMFTNLDRISPEATSALILQEF